MLFLQTAKEQYDITFHDQLNEHMTDNDSWKHARPNHVSILAKTQAGLKNMFKLISTANISYFYRVPRMPHSLLNQYREGLLIGTGDNTGEVFEAIMQKGMVKAKELARYYDYIEVQPKAAYAPLIESELIADEAKLEEILANLVQIGHELDIPVVATGDVHYLNPEDRVYRDVIVKSQGGRTRLIERHYQIYTLKRPMNY